MTIPHKDRRNHPKGYNPKRGLSRKVTSRTPRFDTLECTHVLPRDKFQRYRPTATRQCMECYLLQQMRVTPEFRSYYFTTVLGDPYPTDSGGRLPSKYGGGQASEWSQVWASSKEDALAAYKAGKVVIEWMLLKGQKTMSSTASEPPRSSGAVADETW